MNEVTALIALVLVASIITAICVHGFAATLPIFVLIGIGGAYVWWRVYR